MLSTIRPALRAVAVFILLWACPVAAHEGHDHGAAPEAVAEMTPRAEAVSKMFELVAVKRDDGLDVYLDGFLTNAPITDAVIAVDTPDGSVKASVSGEGLYRIAGPWVVTPGTYPLIFDIKAGGDADVLAATLIVPPSKPDTVTAAPGASRGSQLLLALGGFAAGIAAMVCSVAAAKRPSR